MTDQHTSAKATASPATDAGEQLKELRRLEAGVRDFATCDVKRIAGSAAATIERKDTEIKILVDLLKRGFEISNREGWEEGENKTEWQSIASDALATYDEQFRDSGLRSMESLVALERQQAATIERLTKEVAAEKAERDAAVKVIEELGKQRLPHEIEEYCPGSSEDADYEEAYRLMITAARDFLSKQEGK